MTRSETSIVHKELSFAVIEACIEVHKELGPGYPEKLYEGALVKEFNARAIAFEQQKPITVLYKGDRIGDYRLDLVVDNKIILELKAITDLHPALEAQLYSYLKATGLKLGILINFGKKRLEFRRIVN